MGLSLLLFIVIYARPGCRSGSRSLHSVLQQYVRGQKASPGTQIDDATRAVPRCQVQLDFTYVSSHCRHRPATDCYLDLLTSAAGQTPMIDPPPDVNTANNVVAICQPVVLAIFSAYSSSRAFSATLIGMKMAKNVTISSPDGISLCSTYFRPVNRRTMTAASTQHAKMHLTGSSLHLPS